MNDVKKFEELEISNLCSPEKASLWHSFISNGLVSCSQVTLRTLPFALHMLDLPSV